MAAHRPTSLVTCFRPGTYGFVVSAPACEQREGSGGYSKKDTGQSCLAIRRSSCSAAPWNWASGLRISFILHRTHQTPLSTVESKRQRERVQCRTPARRPETSVIPWAWNPSAAGGSSEFQFLGPCIGGRKTDASWFEALASTTRTCAPRLVANCHKWCGGVQGSGPLPGDQQRTLCHVSALDGRFTAGSCIFRGHAMTQILSKCCMVAFHDRCQPSRV